MSQNPIGEVSFPQSSIPQYKSEPLMNGGLKAGKEGSGPAASLVRLIGLDDNWAHIHTLIPWSVERNGI